ncbi:peptidase, U32 family [Treponema primitia ZAS-2]|uniref:Peptidase, U32 family n=1 Tax=Treponema primitia (strain ATCC BAA-887 / DSM 12427 / ZAS-2) TaxID=545694 RepID=F5YN80_TREPZ|nr:peptidase U32 family protein [Treponema primitia]AEF84691.1 peptidase, U32 family [Treponema primitia ZAS-2]
MVTPKVELLAPAGSPEALDAAIGEGADAVYLGLKNFNARIRSANFAYSQFEGLLRTVHRMNRRVYVTVNTVFEQREADRVYQLLKYLDGLGPDGIIVQDFGIVKMVREHFPKLKLHASTQMNIASARGANILSRNGFSRVVLARELSLEEIREIRDTTNMALEVFVHGALCVSASGLCLFSSYLGGKSANRGMCTQACRRLYQHEDEKGYYFSPGDLQLLEQVPSLVEAGVNSFKIEGRMKSAEYVGAVVSAYRRVIDGLEGDREGSMQEGLAMLRNDFARGKTQFYISGGVEPETLLNPAQDGGTGIALGTILRVRGGDGERQGLIPSGPVMPGVGDSVRFHRADDSDRKSHKLTLAEDEPAERNPGGAGPGPGGRNGHTPNRWISIPEGFDMGDSVYLIQTRAMSRRYPQVIPGNLDSCRRMPGRDRAPEISLPAQKKKETNAFPDGIYGMTSRIEDLFIIQSVRPLRVILEYNRKVAAYLLGENMPPLPFRSGELILSLDPYFPQGMDRALTEEIPLLVERGYREFVVNNPGHFSLFRDMEGVRLIAGPSLYAFNRWSAAFITALGAESLISPLENNRQNWERTIETGRRAQTFITVFAYPALFRIRADLGSIYPFGSFQDGRDERFRLISERDGSRVYPEKPFSIIDKIPFLQEAGFRRFILDFSGHPLKKKDYKDIMDAVKNAAPLPNIVRFNWKDGFFTQDASPAKGVTDNKG